MTNRTEGIATSLGRRAGCRRLALGAMAAAAAVLGGALIDGGAIASGDDGGSGTATTGTGGPGEPVAAPPELAAFQRCMDNHGAVLPSPRPADGSDEGTRLVLPANRAARGDCSAALPGPPDDAVLEGRMKQHRQCMSDHGIDLPAPTSEGSDVSVRIDPAIAESAGFQAAARRCDSILFGGG